MPRLHIDPTAAEPIWHQIENGFRRLIASQALSRGEPLPSVRDLARELRINPATVAKAYRRLCDAGVLTVRRGQGTYVYDGVPKFTKARRDRQLTDAAERYASIALTMGATREESQVHVDSAWARLIKPQEQ
jgi:GntR family transcriptional regulator